MEVLDSLHKESRGRFKATNKSCAHLKSNRFEILFDIDVKAHQLLGFINSQHINISFVFVGEQQQTLPFLDVIVKHDNDKLVTSAFRKKFKGLDMNYFINIYTMHTKQQQ